METASGTLGKSSNISTSNYVDTSGNGMDCHLEKSTEYGTITLLAASEFGNQESTNVVSTAESGTGVYQMSNNKYEYVAGVFETSSTDPTRLSNSQNGALTSAHAKYVDIYVGTTKQSILGDGIFITDGWKSSTKVWREYTENPVVVRGRGGLFGYDFFGGKGTGMIVTNGAANSNIGARAVVVFYSGI